MDNKAKVREEKSVVNPVNSVRVYAEWTGIRKVLGNFSEEPPRITSPLRKNGKKIKSLLVFLLKRVLRRGSVSTNKNEQITDVMYLTNLFDPV